jgi:uncharacterized protein YacL
MAGGGGAFASVLIFVFIAIIQLVVWVYLGSEDKKQRKKIAKIELGLLVILLLSFVGESVFMLLGLTLISPLIFIMLLTPICYKLVQFIKTHNKRIK